MTTAEQRRSLYCYPLVGVLPGVLLWLCASALDATLLSAGLVLVVWIAFSGAIHLDGLADCADAWMAGLGDRKKTMRVLQDPLCGAVAVVTLVAVLLIKVAAIQQLLESGQIAVLVVIPVIARVTPQFLFWKLSYVRQGGLGARLAVSQDDLMFFWCCLGFSVALAMILLGLNGLWLLLITVVVVLVVARASDRRLGGFTGDVVGAQIELVEAALCVTAVLVL